MKYTRFLSELSICIFNHRKRLIPCRKKEEKKIISENLEYFFVLRWEKEVQTRKSIEGDFAAYKKKADFDMNVLMQQLAEMKQRLEATTSTILTLESRVREGGRSDTNIQELLRKVRLAAEDELKKHQSATDAKYSKSVIFLFLL